MTKLSFCFYLSLVLLFSAFPEATIAQTNNTTILIQQTCKKCARNDPNIDYDFCVTSLQSAPSSRCITNLRGFGLLSLKLLCRNVTSTQRRVRDLLRDKKWDPYTRACLEDCFDLYSDAVPTLHDTVRDYRAKRYDDANVEVSSVMDVSVTCEDGFLEKRGSASPLTKRNNDTFQLAAMVLSIISMIKIQR